MPSCQELIKEHQDNKCKYCDKHDCSGITFTINQKTRCDKYER